MTESATAPDLRTFTASDGYPLHVAVWPPTPTVPAKGLVVALHGVQSHSGWYPPWVDPWPPRATWPRSPIAAAPAPTRWIGATPDRPAG